MYWVVRDKDLKLRKWSFQKNEFGECQEGGDKGKNTVKG
jgi:hypothetical protein